MIMNEFLEKHRLTIGLVLIGVVVVASTILLWQRKNVNDKIAKNNLAVEVELSNIQKENQDLKQQLENYQGSQSSQSGPDDFGTVKSTVSSSLININTASASVLDQLPGVGPTRAQQIIDYRNTNGPFQKIEDIQKIKGIGPATYDKMKHLISI